MKKRIHFLLILVLLLVFPHLVFAADLPIDPATITDQTTEQQAALTARHGVDLFSDRAQEVAEAMAARRAEERAAARTTLFLAPWISEPTDPQTQLRQAVSEARLFSAPMQFGTSIQTESEGASIPLWVIISLLTAAAGLGILIAARSMSRRKERENNVHHTHA